MVVEYSESRTTENYAALVLAVSVTSLITLAILERLMCALAAFETMRSREFRRELRAQ